MLVIVDTPVWSLALRRRSTDLNETERGLVEQLAELIQEGRVLMLGPIRQELLSGIREGVTFTKVREHLRAFDEPALEIADYEGAARISNQCRAKGIAGSAIDFLLCAAAQRRHSAIFTTDQDFQEYATVIPLRLLAV